jgi:hypothetical protein
MEIKKTLFNPLIIIIAIAVIFAIGVDIYVLFNIKTQSAPKPYYAKNTKVTYNTTNTVGSTTKVNTSDVTETKSKSVEYASNPNIVTDTSVVSSWRTWSGDAFDFDGHEITIKYPTNWSLTPDEVLYLRNTTSTPEIPGSYEINISKYHYTDDINFTNLYGQGDLVKINNYSAKYAYKIEYNNINTDNYLITIGDSKYLCTVKFKVPRDTVGEQVLSTLQVK